MNKMMIVIQFTRHSMFEIKSILKKEKNHRKTNLKANKVDLQPLQASCWWVCDGLKNPSR